MNGKVKDVDETNMPVSNMSLCKCTEIYQYIQIIFLISHPTMQRNAKDTVKRKHEKTKASCSSIKLNYACTI